MLLHHGEDANGLFRGDWSVAVHLELEDTYSTPEEDEPFRGYLARLLIAMSLPRVALGKIPADSEYLVPQFHFRLLDRRKARVETICAELAIT
ncbi:hypothetical protein [Nocardia acidivorans]|uniref:hypothetical protein n=1 Tax=Nocardia acidivorans TaxID=404580 RepID=UPI00082DA8FE|nr:hypothetical protein [Nocardia acidivorans]